MAKAYEGEQPYIFVSYSHKDKAEVMRCIQTLQKNGFRVWFDGGIEAGSEWPEYIANHLAGCECVMAFISSNFAQSNNCRQELNFAQSLKKELLSVYLEEGELPLGLQMQLGLYQAIRKSNYSTAEAFVESLCEARMIQSCKEAPKSEPKPEQKPEPKPEPKPEQKPEPKPEPKPEQKPEPKPEPKPEQKPEPKPEPKPEKEKPVVMREEEQVIPPEEQTAARKRCKRIGWTVSLLELAYAPLSFAVMHYASAAGINGWGILGIMIAPHILIAVINRLLLNRGMADYRKLGKKEKQQDEIATSALICFLLSSIVAAIGGMFFLHYEMFFLWKLLISIGVNVIPFVGAGLITLFFYES